MVTQPGGMYCLDAEDRHGEVVGLPGSPVHCRQQGPRVRGRQARPDRRSRRGKRRPAGHDPVRGMDIKLINSQTDRIYLASDTGLVQCLHEVELAEPIRHNLPAGAGRRRAGRGGGAGRRTRGPRGAGCRSQSVQRSGRRRTPIRSIESRADQARIRPDVLQSDLPHRTAELGASWSRAGNPDTA